MKNEIYGIKYWIKKPSWFSRLRSWWSRYKFYRKMKRNPKFLKEALKELEQSATEAQERIRKQMLKDLSKGKLV